MTLTIKAETLESAKGAHLFLELQLSLQYEVTGDASCCSLRSLLWTIATPSVGAPVTLIAITHYFFDILGWIYALLLVDTQPTKQPLSLIYCWTLKSHFVTEECFDVYHGFLGTD